MPQLLLPACVESRDDGKIVVRGHRVSLHLILDAHYSGLTIDEICDRYPSIPREAVREIVEFCADHDEEMRQFHAECEAERQRIAGTIETPDLQELRRQFEALRDEWKVQSEFLSSTTDMALLWPYQSIIGMGADVVPLILEELSRETDHWFWALKAITKADPVPPEDRGNIRAMTAAWLRWGREQGLIDDAGTA